MVQKKVLLVSEKEESKKLKREESGLSLIDRVFIIDIQVGSTIFPILCCEVDSTEEGESKVLQFFFCLLTFFALLTLLASIPNMGHHLSNLRPNTKKSASAIEPCSESKMETDKLTISGYYNKEILIKMMRLGAKIFLFDTSAAVGFFSGCCIQRLFFMRFYGINATRMMTAGTLMGIIWIVKASRLSQFYLDISNQSKLDLDHEKMRNLVKSSKQWSRFTICIVTCFVCGILVYTIVYIHEHGNSKHFVSSVVLWAFGICLMINSTLSISTVIQSLQCNIVAGESNEENV